MNSTDQIIPILNNLRSASPAASIPAGITNYLNAYIKSLKAKAVIKTLAEISLPQFALEDSQSKRQQQGIDLEWKSPRKQLDLYLAETQTSEWISIGSVALLNPSGYPYRVYNVQDAFTDNLAVEVGEDSRVGVGIVDAGFGLLGAGDSVVVFGSALQEVVTQENEEWILRV